MPGEVVAELRADLAHRGQAEAFTEGERVPVLLGAARPARDAREYHPGVAPGCFPAPAADEDLAEGDARLGLELVLMGVEICPELLLLGRGHRVLEQKLHLLPEPPPDDGIVLVEAELESRAVEHLLADVVAYLGAPLLGVRRAVPGARERQLEPIDIGSGDGDLAVVRRAHRQRGG